MGKLTIFGDSLTGGRYGIWFGRFLKHEADCHGIDGQYMDDILNRAVRFCRQHPDLFVVVEGGVNDVVLAQCRKNVFDSWTDTIQRLTTLCRGLYLCTMTPIGEDPKSRQNQIRDAINSDIRSHAKTYGYGVIDVAKAMDKKLSGYGIKKNPLDLMIDDRARLSKYEGEELEHESMDISNSRNFFLTIDGVHLNWEGAKIMASCIDNALSKVGL